MEWISTKERVPERKLGPWSDKVLAIIGENITIMTYDHALKGWPDRYGNLRIVDWWMPLPSLPEGVSG